MYSLNRNHPSNGDSRGNKAAHVAHTYRQIASILTKKEEEPISPAEVKRLCRKAEAKLARALLADLDTLMKQQHTSDRWRNL